MSEIDDELHALEELTPPAGGGWKRQIVQWMPWVVTVAILVWILRTTDLGAMWAAVQQADWLLFWGSMMVLFTMLWIVDAVAILWIYRRAHASEMKLTDVLPVRGTTYIVGILNYAAASAAMAIYFRKVWKIGMVEGGSSLLLLLLVDLGLAILCTTTGSFLLPEEYRGVALLLGAGFAVAAVAHLVFWRAPWSWGPLEKLREWPRLRGIREARLVDYAVAGLLRAPMTALYVGMHMATLAAFNIHVPLERMLVYVPIQMVVAVLPISVSGLGAGQAAQRLLYRPFAEATHGADALAVVDAYGLALFLGFLVPRVLIGVFSLRYTTRELARVDQH